AGSMNCASCHGADVKTNTSKILNGKNAASIQTAINNNVGGMGVFSALTATQVANIAAYITTASGGATPAPIPAPTPTPAPVATPTPAPGTTPPTSPAPPAAPSYDGKLLYQNNCASCHGVDVTKNTSRIQLGKSSATIQSAIAKSMGGMSYLLTLKAGEIDAIAAYITDPAGYQPAAVPAPSAPAAGLWNTVPVTMLGQDDLLTVLSGGKLWFIKGEDNQIGYIDAANKSAAPKIFSLATGSGAKAIAAGPDKRIWFTESKANLIGAIDPVTGTIMTYSPRTANSQPNDIAAGDDGNMWFTETAANKIGVMIASGAMAKEIAVPTANAGLGQIIKGLNNTIWFVERDAGKIGRIDVATGNVTEISLPAGSKPKGIALHATTGDIWVTDISRNKVLRINPSTQAVDKEFDAPLGKTPDRIMYCSTGDMYFTHFGSSKVGGINGAGILNAYKLRADDVNDGFRAHDLIEEANGLMWFVNTPNSAPVVTAVSTAPANTQAEILSVTEATLDANAVGAAPLSGSVGPAAQNAGGGGCVTDLFSKPDPTLPLILLAAVVYLRRKFIKQI
ncbi:MAG: c-type cytochrome, partial [Burkholderiales bacterium]